MKALTMAACVLLGACNSSPSQAPAAGATAQAPVAAADTLAADTLPSRPAPRATVPFVNPTKVGRVLGSQTPSPPASRTR